MGQSPPPGRKQAIKPGPSREMLGGPLVGVALFVVIAILLGWGLISLMNTMLDQTRQDLSATGIRHGFVTDGTYQVDKAMLLGYAVDGRLMLYPERDDLPTDAPNRRRAATINGFRDYQATVASGGEGEARYKDIAGVVEPGTALRIDKVIEDADNQQTRLLLQCTILDGEFAGEPAIGLHLETQTVDKTTGERRYEPRPGLLTLKTPAQEPERLQSPPTTDDRPDARPTDAPPPDAP